MAGDGSDARFTTTLRALAAPRRALPIAAVTAAMVGVQLYYASPETAARAALVPLAMAASFALLAPWSWRAWGRRSRLGMIGYGAMAVAVIGGGGAALPRALDLGATYFTDVGSLGIAVVLYAVGGWGLGRDLELEDGLEEARLLALHTHLDPHFLYNTLNAIAEWCAEDPKVAEEAITRLAGMMRELLAGLELARWPLHREVKLAEDLLELHRVRDGEAMTARVTLDAAAKDLELPPLLLLALAENAVKHGPRSGHRGLVEIEVALGEGSVVCRVENPGPFAPAEPWRGGGGDGGVGGGGAGHGLRTLQRRLQHAYRGRARLQLSQRPGPRTAAVLTLPRSRPSRGRP